METKIIDFKCSNCGGALQSTNQVNGKVECVYCHTECVIEGLIKNAEILEKENINSGVSINLSKERLNQLVIDALTEDFAYPLDVLENSMIIKETHVCVPSYLFYCNGSTSFTYDVGNERQQQVIHNKNTKSKSYIEWTHMSSSTNASDNIISSGNRMYSELVQNLFKKYDVNKLEDVEELTFPNDVETLKFNLPQPAAFEDFVKPRFEKLLADVATKSLAGKTYKNLSIGGCNVQKGEVFRISLGIYELTFQYQGNTYTLYISGDGSDYMWDVKLVDNQRLEEFTKMKEEEAHLSKKSLFKTLTIASFALVFFNILLAIVFAGVFGYLWFKQKQDLKAVRVQIDDFTAESKSVKQAFIQSGTIISGIK